MEGPGPAGLGSGFSSSSEGAPEALASFLQMLFLTHVVLDGCPGREGISLYAFFLT